MSEFGYAGLLVLAFLSGALPFSVWIGRIALGVDVRHYGDSNPGATNVFRAGGRVSGVLAVLLDFAKGALPVGLAYLILGIGFPLMAFLALLPVLGHAYSPFLGFHGGKAVAVTVGIWCGLTAWVGPIVLGAGLYIFMRLLGPNGRAVLAAMVVFAIVVAFAPAAIFPPNVATDRAWLLVTLAGNAVIVGWKHRADLTVGRDTHF